jgi:hypothetical protein
MGAELLDAVVSWRIFVVALLVFGFAPGAMLRLIVLAFHPEDPRRRELLAELHCVPRIERPFWVIEQLEVALFEGIGSRRRYSYARRGGAGRRGYFARSGRRIVVFLGRPTDLPDTARLFTWIGMFALALGSAYLGIGQRGLLDFDGEKPEMVFVGWGLMHDTLSLGGYQSIALSVGVAGFIVGTALAIYTKGYTYAPRWANAMSVGVGLLGVPAVAPLTLFLALLLLNIILWVLAAVLGILLSIFGLLFLGPATSADVDRKPQ